MRDTQRPMPYVKWLDDPQFENGLPAMDTSIQDAGVPAAAPVLPETAPAAVGPTVEDLHKKIWEREKARQEQEASDIEKVRTMALKSQDIGEGPLGLGIVKKLAEMPDARKQMLTDSLKSLDYYNQMGLALPAGELKGGREPGPAPEAGMPSGLDQSVKLGKVLQETGAGKQQNLSSQLGLANAMEDEKKGSQKAQNAFSLIQRYLPDALPKGLTGDSVSFNDLKPVLDKVPGIFGTESRSKDVTTKLTAQQEKDEEKFSMWLSSKLQAKMRPNPDRPGEFVDTNMGINLPPDLAAHYRRIYQKETGAPLHLPSVGGGLGASGIAPSPVGPTPPAPAAGAGQKGEAAAPTGYAVTPEKEVYNLGSKRVQDQAEKLTKALSTSTPHGVPIKNAIEAQRRAQNMRANIGEQNIGPDNMPKTDPTPLQLAELAIQLNSLLSGRVGGSTAEFKELLPHGIEGDVTKLEQYFTSAPGKVGMKKWVQTFLSIADREAKQADAFVKGELVKNVEGTGFAVKDKAPRKWEAILRAQGLDPDAFHKDGTVGDYTYLSAPQVHPSVLERAKAQGKVFYYNYKTGEVQATATPPGKPWASVGG